MTISDPGRGLVRRLGLAAAAHACVLAAASQQRAEALSLVSPGTAPSAKFATDGSDDPKSAAVTAVVAAAVVAAGSMAVAVASAVAAFHGGGFRGGGAAFHGGGFRGGGLRSAAAAFARLSRVSLWRLSPRLLPAALLSPASLPPALLRTRPTIPYYYGYPHRYCRVIWTYYGPRRICRYRPWHRHHWRLRHYGITTAIGEIGVAK